MYRLLKLPYRNRARAEREVAGLVAHLPNATRDRLGLLLASSPAPEQGLHYFTLLRERQREAFERLSRSADGLRHLVGVFTHSRFLSDELLEHPDWADQLLDALEYLHSQKPPIIHRDIKPQNLKLTPRGEVILLDFGLAKGIVTHQSQVSQSIRGYTPNYASLEQIRGTGTDARSDIDSIGAMMYHLLTGEMPQDAPPLDEDEVALIRTWIEQGAQNN